MSPFVTTPEVAGMVGMSVSLFRQRRETLIEDAGFPQPMPTCYRPMRWRRDQVQVWLDQQGRPRAHQMPERPVGTNIHLLEEARRA